MTVGLDMKLYYDTAGAGNGTWVELDIVGDVSVADSFNKATRKIRKNKVQRTVLGQRVHGLTVPVTYIKGDPGWNALKTAYDAGDIIGMAAMSEEIINSGAEGVQGDYYITDFPSDQPLEEDNVYNLTFEPAAEADDDPEMVTIA